MAKAESDTPGAPGGAVAAHWVGPLGAWEGDGEAVRASISVPRVSPLGTVPPPVLHRGVRAWSFSANTLGAPHPPRHGPEPGSHAQVSTVLPAESGRCRVARVFCSFHTSVAPSERRGLFASSKMEAPKLHLVSRSLRGSQVSVRRPRCPALPSSETPGSTGGCLF